MSLGVTTAHSYSFTNSGFPVHSSIYTCYLLPSVCITAEDEWSAPEIAAIVLGCVAGVLVLVICGFVLSLYL